MLRHLSLTIIVFLLTGCSVSTFCNSKILNGKYPNLTFIYANDETEDGRKYAMIACVEEPHA